MRRFWHDNGLSIILFALFAACLGAQSVVGQRRYNAEQVEHEQSTLSYGEYLRSPEFLEATAENWESEFLQMAAYVMLTALFFQRGSAESKDPDGRPDPVDRRPDPKRPGAPWAVRRSALARVVYSHSLMLAFVVLFMISFTLHAIGGAADYNEEQAAHGNRERVSVLGYVATSRFWFESLQNWQSEFLAVLSIVVLSIFLRQRGSPESKPVDAPHVKTASG